MLIREDVAGKFETIRAINELGFDERALFYRSSPCVVDANDWFADVEASAESFVPETQSDPVEARENVIEDDECGPAVAASCVAVAEDVHPQPFHGEHVDTGSEGVMASEPTLPKLDEDWYLLSQFAELAGCSPDETLKLELFA